MIQWWLHWLQRHQSRNPEGNCGIYWSQEHSNYLSAGMLQTNKKLKIISSIFKYYTLVFPKIAAYNIFQLKSYQRSLTTLTKIKSQFISS